MDFREMSADIHGPQRMNPIDFADPSAFFVAPPPGLICYLVKCAVITASPQWMKSLTFAPFQFQSISF